MADSSAGEGRPYYSFALFHSSDSTKPILYNGVAVNLDALTAAVYNAVFNCTMTTNAIGASGTVMPDGFALVQLGAGTTTGPVAVESATAAITDSLSTQDWLYVTFIGTSGTGTAEQLLDLNIETL
ncbi:MAG: hypothetical protein JWQ87_5213 [Candidatus Sulfotelmatobacter sp.]|nr:hypothetical protein [Candidatus Sulfotelmatobacter sp.]